MSNKIKAVVFAHTHRELDNLFLMIQNRLTDISKYRIISQTDYTCIQSDNVIVEFLRPTDRIMGRHFDYLHIDDNVLYGEYKNCIRWCGSFETREVGLVQVWHLLEYGEI